MILLIDNYDSFSYNLYQMIGEINPNIKVIRNDELTIEEIRDLNPREIILSPGPGRPEDAGITVDVVKELGSSFKILGVCLGHQSICYGYGGEITYSSKLFHGKQSKIIIKKDCKIFKGLGESFLAARYHSLTADKNKLPKVLEVIATTENGEIMAVKHREYEVYGVQFHPESILTPKGKLILKNFID
ncbi:MAG: anthranilate synthase component II [Lachnospirales bacterium]